MPVRRTTRTARKPSIAGRLGKTKRKIKRKRTRAWAQNPFWSRLLGRGAAAGCLLLEQVQLQRLPFVGVELLRNLLGVLRLAGRAVQVGRVVAHQPVDLRLHLVPFTGDSRLFVSHELGRAG